MHNLMLDDGNGLATIFIEKCQFRLIVEALQKHLDSWDAEGEGA